MRFSNRRTIAEGTYDSKEPWLSGVTLSPVDRAQLLFVVRLFGPTVTEEELLTGDERFFYRRAQAIAESAVEWWDVGDDEPLFQLWLCDVDSGYLFDAGTTTMRANVIEADFDIDHALPDDVRRSLGEAAKRAAATAPDSQLAAVDFSGEVKPIIISS
jgi:hypothetical protein